MGTGTGVAPAEVVTSPKLSYVARYSYGVGHVFNDLCASMWFSYLLVFFEKVLEFNPTKAGLILLVGQLADGISTPIVGIFSDKENKIKTCANYGRRKVWHLMGTVFVLVSFPFIFTSCLGCKNADENVQMAYYCSFVILFQFGWACVQISHLSLIPELTTKKHCRTELNSIRYAFTVLSNLSVYTIAFLFLSMWNSTPSGGSELGSNSTTVITEVPNSGSSICPDDANEFRNIALFCICAGSFFSAIFHFGVKEPVFRDPAKKPPDEVEPNELGVPPHTGHHMRKRDWFKEIALYQIAILYMSTRLYVNLYQVYIPFYVQDTLFLGKTTVATVPFAMYFAGFLGSLVMKQINRKIGRKATFILGCSIGLAGCAWVMFGESDAYRTWGVYCVAALLGIGGSTVLITSLSITSDLIGNNVEGGAFVYGFMSFVDKVSSGVIIVIIQDMYNEDNEFYRNVITFGCGSSCVLGIIVAISLIPIKVGERRGLSKKLVNIISGVEDKSVLEISRPAIHEECSTIYTGVYRNSIIKDIISEKN